MKLWLQGLTEGVQSRRVCEAQDSTEAKVCST